MSRIAITTEESKKEQGLQKSNWMPIQSEIEIIGRVNRDHTLAMNLRNRTWREFNDLTLLDRESLDQKIFNGYVPPRDETSDESWKAQTVRPITRNKVIAIAAHITSSIIAPRVFAQNENEEMDRDSARVMEDIMEWANNQANYSKTFLRAVTAMLINPTAFVFVGYQEIKKIIKEIQLDGTWKEKEIIDEDNSGFVNFNVPIDEILLGNFYIEDIQKQPFIFWDRNIDWTIAKRKYGDLDNFEFVKPGLRVVFNEDDRGFYEEEDLDLEGRLVNEVIYYNKNEDLELVFLNGVLMTAEDQPIGRLDKQYPLVNGGYELIDEGKFAYFKSLVFKLSHEQRMIDELYNMHLDGTLMALMPPSAIFGEEMIDSGIVTPGATVTFSDPNTRMEMFHPRSDLTAGLNALSLIESNMAEGSRSTIAPEALPAGRTAFEVASIENSNRVMLGLFGKMIAQMVKDWGELRKSDILQFMTVTNVQDITSQKVLKYKTLILDDKVIEGINKSRRVEFDLNVPEEEVPENQALLEELELLEREKKTNSKIFRINPKLFRKLKFKVRVEPDVMFQPSRAFLTALNLDIYDRAIQNPLANQEAIFRDFLLETLKPGEADKYIAKPKEPEKSLSPVGQERPILPEQVLAPEKEVPIISPST